MVKPEAIPEAIEVDVSELEINYSKHLSDITLPEGVKAVVAHRPDAGHHRAAVGLRRRNEGRRRRPLPLLLPPPLPPRKPAWCRARKALLRLRVLRRARLRPRVRRRLRVALLRPRALPRRRRRSEAARGR